MIETHTLIFATEEKVWDILTDFSGYPEWNPFIRSITGSLREGEKLTAVLQLPSFRKLVRFNPQVLQIHKNERLRWRTTLLIPKLFEEVHTFDILPHPTGVSFIHKKTFSGLLVSFRAALLAKMEEGFKLMNQALKQRAEAK